MFKKVLIALSVLLNVCFLFFVFWGGGVVEKFAFIIANGLDENYNSEFEFEEGKSFEDQFGVSEWVLNNTTNSIAACSVDFRCMQEMQFLYFRGLAGSLAEYQGDVYACKAKWDEGESPFTVLTTEKAKDFQCVKMTKKYKGLSTDAIQSDSDDLEGVEKVKFE